MHLAPYVPRSPSRPPALPRACAPPPPLTSSAHPPHQVAFLGPLANATTQLLSNYHGSNTLVESHSPLLAARARGVRVRHARGCNVCDVVPEGFPNMPCPDGHASDTSGFKEALDAAAAAQVAVVFVGLDQTRAADLPVISP